MNGFRLAQSYFLQSPCCGIAYVAYRQAGYSKKFRQEHEEEILLHQAAKANVDRLLNMETEHDTEKEKGHEQR